jgi:hypothetical protein
MEGALALLDRNAQPLSHNLRAAIVRQFEIIHAGHDTRKVVV